MRYPALWLAVLVLVAGGCLRYGFTGVSIPADVRTIYIPFFQDRSGSGLADLPDRLNRALVDRFVNQTRLQLVSDASLADIVLDGTITGYGSRPFSIGGNEEAALNRVTISVRASFKYAREANALWDKGFTGTAEYDPSQDPITREQEAADLALERIAQNLFTDSVGRW